MQDLKNGFLLFAVYSLTICASAQNGANDSIQFPFSFNHNEIVLHVTINGKGPYAMLLDTGTDPSAIDFLVAREVGLDRGAATNRPYMVTLPSLAVGAFSVPKITAIAADVSP